MSSTAAATAVRAIATTEVDSDRTVTLAEAMTSPPTGLLTETTTGKSPDVRADTSTSTDFRCPVSVTVWGLVPWRNESLSLDSSSTTVTGYGTRRTRVMGMVAV